MTKTLVSWIAMRANPQSGRPNDLAAMQGNAPWWTSPIARIIASQRPTRILLLSNGRSISKESDLSAGFQNLAPDAEWVVRHSNGDQEDWENPFWCWRQVQTICRLESRGGIKFIANAESGTPAMVFSMHWLAAMSPQSTVLMASPYCEKDPGGAVTGLCHPLDTHGMRSDSLPTRAQGRGADAAAQFEFKGSARTDLVRSMREAAMSEVPILLVGEPGTGKSWYASRIHEWSRRAGTLQSVNCGVFGDDRSRTESELFGHVRGAYTGAEKDREGACQLAGSGTLFLDEIGAIPPASQTVLLRALEERLFYRLGGMGREPEIPFVARLVSATNEPLGSADRFRRDLLDRISGVVFRVPSLRETPEDIPGLAADALARFNEEQARLRRGGDLPEWKGRSLDGAAIEALKSYTWPGNIRELQMVIRSAALGCLDNASKAIGPREVRGAIEGRVNRNEEALQYDPFVLGLEEAVKRVEISAVKKAMQMSGGNKTGAAKILKLYKSETNPGRMVIDRVLRGFANK